MLKKKVKIKIMIIGAGSWGKALANHLVKNSYQVFLNIRTKKTIEELNKNDLSSIYSSDIKLKKSVKLCVDYKSDVDFVFIVVPSINATDVFRKISQTKFSKSCCFVICSKGIDKTNFSLLSESFESLANKKNHVVLSGPNFAAEVAKSLPTVTTVASSNKKMAQRVIEILNSKTFYAQYFHDEKTAEICGVVKNILAIGCGILEGLGLGVNSKSALVIKGVQEIQMLCKKMKASTDLVNPAGFGDIFLTCSSSKSRNNSLGVLIVKGKKPDQNITYEGVSSARNIIALAQKHGLKLKLCEEINEIINNKFSKTEIQKRIISAILQ